MAKKKSNLGLCPFSWIQVTESPGCLGGLFGEKEKMIWKPQPCMGVSCQLWDFERNDCGLVSHIRRKLVPVQIKKDKEKTTVQKKQNEKNEEILVPEETDKSLPIFPGMPMIRCATCGAPVSPYNKVCPTCGENLEENSNKER